MNSARIYSMLLPLFLISFTPPVHAGAGSKGGGGGNPRGSTEEEVLKAIEKVTEVPSNYLAEGGNIFIAFWQLNDHSKKVTDGTLNPVFQKMLVKSGPKNYYNETAIYRDLSHTHYDIHKDSLCKAHQQHRSTTASTLKQLEAPICLSVPALMALPRDSLESQLRALLAHEYTHHFGYGEKTANAVQTFFLTQGSGIIENDWPLRTLQLALEDFELRARRTLGKLTSKTEVIGDGGLCMEIEGMYLEASKVEDKIREGMGENKRNEFEPTVFEPWWQDTRKLAGAAWYLKNFCGEGVMKESNYGQSGYPVKFGDRKELEFSLVYLNQAIQDFGKKIGATWWP